MSEASNRTAIVYTRVSGEEQAKKGYSLPDQRWECERWCEQNGYAVAEVVEDAGWSGGYPERPGLDRVREMVAEGGVGVTAMPDGTVWASLPFANVIGVGSLDSGSKSTPS